MSSPVDKFAPTTAHCLEVAFSSDSRPIHIQAPIAMAYGFAYGAATDNSFGNSYSVATGQMKDTMKLNQQVYFKIFDTAQYAATLTKVLITFDDNKSPFSWSSRSFPGDEVLPRRSSIPEWVGKDVSHGCNLWGTEWFCGPYQAVNLGDFECTIWVWVKSHDFKDKVFNVDPEMIIKGG